MDNAPTNTVMVSVIVPNYNHSPYLKQRINSILAQSMTDFELILLDDCSTDNSESILMSYKSNPKVSHVVINEQNSGSPFKQWDKGIALALAKGKYIWIAESDDYAEPEFLERTTAALERYPSARVATTGSYFVDAEGKNTTMELDVFPLDDKEQFYTGQSYLQTKMLSINSVYNASMALFRREGCMDNLDMQYKSMRYCGDWFFWIQQIQKGDVVQLHTKLNYFRQHAKSTTKEGSNNGASLLEIISIRKYYYATIPLSSNDRLIDKGRLYRVILNDPYTPERRRELYTHIKNELNANFISYIRFKLLRMAFKIKLAYNKLKSK